MKTKLKTTLALFAAFCGLQLFAVTYDSGTASDNHFSSGVKWVNFQLSLMATKPETAGDSVSLQNLGLKFDGNYCGSCTYAVLTLAVDSPKVLAISESRGSTTENYTYFTFASAPVISKTTKYRIYFYSSKPEVALGADVPTGYKDNWGVRVCKPNGGSNEMGLQQNDSYMSAWSMETRVNVELPAPVAVWDGNFSYLTMGGVTLNVNGNEVQSGKTGIKITKTASDASNGVLLSGFDSTGVTILTEYTDLTIGAENYVSLITAGSEASDDWQDLVGICSTSSGSAGVYQSGYYGTATEPAVPSTTSTPNRLAYVQDHTGNTGAKAYLNTGSSWASVYTASGLKASNKPLKYACVGGISRQGTKYSTNPVVPATGMVIKRIAVFPGVLTANDLAAYK